METLKFRTQVGSDGILHLEILHDFRGQEVEVVLVVQSLKTPYSEAQRAEWLAFIEETAGSLADDPIERGPQGEHEIRDEIE